MEGNPKVSANTGAPPSGLASVDPLGSRVARARQEAGLTEKELAKRLGLPLWRIERLQHGDDDPHRYLLEIAEATGKPAPWFLANLKVNGGTESDGPTGGESGLQAELTEDRPASHPSSSLERLRTAGMGLSKRRRVRRPGRGERLDVEGATPGHKVLEPAQRVAASNAVAARVARARQESGLSQKRLAALLEVPLWRIERMERGDEDPADYLAAIATATGRDAQWFTEPIETTPASTDDEGSAGEITTALAPGMPSRVSAREAALLSRSFRRRIVVAALVLLVVSRFFTEALHLLPRAAKLVDIPVLILLAAVALTLPRARLDEKGFPYFGLGVLFLVIALLSALVNLGRVAPAPALLFLYGFLAPLAVYYAVYRLWPPGQTLSMSRFLMKLAALELLVVALIDLPRFLASHNPDDISGTFGENGYQLVFFLLMVAGVVAGVYTFERRRLAAQLAPLFFAATLGTILLAQYRALLLTTALTVLLIATLLGFIRLRGAIASLLMVVTFALSLSYLSAQFPVLRYSETVGTLVNDPGLYVSKRASVAGAVTNLYNDDPLSIVTGTGPGTFSSRAWYTFQPASRTQKALGLNPGGKQGYHTDVSTKYVLPRLQKGKRLEAVGGSYAITSPLSSYTSLLAEVGIFGFLAMISIYGGALFQAIRMTVQSVRQPLRRDPLPGLLLGCTAGFFVLLQMAVLENWFEVTRLTFVIWALMAVATKEFSARYGRRAFSAGPTSPTARPPGSR